MLALLPETDESNNVVRQTTLLKWDKTESSDARISRVPITIIHLAFKGADRANRLDGGMAMLATHCRDAGCHHEWCNCCVTATLESSCQQNITILVKLSVSMAMFGPGWQNLTNLYNFMDKSGILLKEGESLEL